jgi:tRNA threonylcarbamoyladenosine biosynthesis protein TsaB
VIVLAADTSTSMGSVALLDGDTLIAETRLQMGRGHSERLLPAIEGLLALTGRTLEKVDLIGVGLGPGSFTGLRIGVVTMRMLGYALGIPVKGASSLEALCAPWMHQDAMLVSTLDAFKGEVYAGAYHSNAKQLARIGDEAVFPPETLGTRIRELAESGPVHVFGPGYDRYRERIGDVGPNVRHVPELVPLASGVARCALRSEEPASPVTPHYVRKSEAELTWSSRHSGAGTTPLTDSRAK